jgi:pimeloyl-ACP methyl ester carboxylesterase
MKASVLFMPLTVGRRRHAALAAAILVSLAAIWLQWKPGQREMEEFMNSTTSVVAEDGTRIAFTNVGSGPALVIVDGAFCYRENGPAMELARVLAEHFTVYAYDRRGRGQSDSLGPYSIEREIDDLRAVVAAAGGSAAVLGISSGAALALEAAANGVGVERLVLYEPPLIEEAGQPRSYAAARAELQTLTASGDRAGATRFFLTDVMGVPRAFSYLMPFVMHRTWVNNTSVAHTLIYDLAILDDWPRLKKRSGSIQAPSLVVAGEKSPQSVRDAAATVAAMLPNARAVYLKGQNHNLQPTALAPVLYDFLRR